MAETIEIQEVYELQKRKSLSLRTEDPDERKLRLTRLQQWIEEHLVLIQDALYADFRKAEMEVNLSEIYPTLSEIRLANAKLQEWAYPKQVKSPSSFMAATSQIHYEPKGTSLIISPWNYPFFLSVGPLVSALAAGNTAILKPSEFSPNTSRLLRQMAEEIFDPAEVSVFTGDVSIAKDLLELPFDHIFFTGSTETGKKIMQAAAKNLSSVTLELGGKSPAIVSASSSPSEAAERIAWGKLLNAGQTCVAPDYVLVHSSLRDEFIREYIFYVQKLYGRGGEKFQEGGDYARIIDEKHFNRLAGAMNESLDNGANLIYGGGLDKSDLYIQPSLIENVALDDTLMKEEIFGPILPLLTYDSIDEAISFINERPKPLASYLFGQNEETYQKVLRETSAGSLVYNDCVVQAGHPYLPFGGVNGSGMGKSHGEYGFRAFSNEKAVIKQRLPVSKLIYPPYSRMTGKVINYMLKYL